MKYKDCSYYRNIVNASNGKITYKRIIVYLGEKKLKRFDSGYDYDLGWLKYGMQRDDFFDPYVFDAIVKISKMKDIDGFFKKIAVPQKYYKTKLTIGTLERILNR